MKQIIITSNLLSYTHEFSSLDTDGYSVNVSPLCDDNGAVIEAIITTSSGAVTTVTPPSESALITFNVSQIDDINDFFVLKISFENGQVRNVLFKTKIVVTDLNIGGDYGG